MHLNVGLVQKHFFILIQRKEEVKTKAFCQCRCRRQAHIMLRFSDFLFSLVCHVSSGLKGERERESVCVCERERDIAIKERTVTYSTFYVVRMLEL